MKQCISLIIVILCFHCTHMSLRPLSFSVSQKIDCTVPQVFAKVISCIEDSLFRQNARSTSILRVNANYGSPDKFVRLFKTDGDSSSSCILVFRFRDRYNYDFFSGKMILRGDLKNIEKTVCFDQASVVIGEIIDHYFYVRLSDNEIRELSFAQSMTGQVGPIGFEIPYVCRDAWRSFVGN